MPGSFVITVPLEGFEAKSSELAHVQHACDLVMKLARGAGGSQTAGVITGDRHAVIASFRYKTNCER
jgi:hypothetical protein